MALSPGSTEHRRFYAAFAQAGYKPDSKIPAGYIRDPQLSNRNRSVFVNPETRHLILAERGTIPRGKTLAADIGTDALLAVGMEAYGSRFKNSLKTMKKARNAYGDEYSYSATGHSLGASAATYISNKLPYVNSVGFSGHLPTGRIGEEAMSNLLGKNQKKRSTQYSVLGDPVAAGYVISGSSHLVNKTARSAHSLDNFL